MDTRDLVQELVQYAETGRSAEAYERFYDEDYVAQENSDPPRVGRAASLQRMQVALQQVQEVHENRAVRVIVEGDTSVVEWTLEFTDVQGRRVRLEEVAVQQWKGRRIVFERFYYGPPLIR